MAGFPGCVLLRCGRGDGGGSGGGGDGSGFFPRVRGFWDNVRQFIPRQRFFFLFFLSGDSLAHPNFTLLARIGPQ